MNVDPALQPDVASNARASAQPDRAAIVAEQTVVVVHNYRPFADVIGHILRDSRYRVLPCPDGRRAYPLIKAARPALAIVDLWLLGIPARELVEGLRADAETAGVPVVVCWTSAADLAAADGWLAELGCETLPVPFELEELRQKVASLTEST